MPERPRIAIPTPTSADLDYNRRCWPDYERAVYTAGGTAVEIPLTHSSSELKQLAHSCVGFVLPGSPADVDPGRYGQQAVAECAPFDAAREAVDLLLVEQAEERGIPLLGICFGAQILNVAHGGTLLQDLMVMPVNHSAGPAVASAHSVIVMADSLLGSLLPGGGGNSRKSKDDVLRLHVNSSHHQAVGFPGVGLRVTARCPEDGVIEAFEGEQDRFLVAVQWHPERNYAESSASQALFESFLDASRRA